MAYNTLSLFKRKIPWKNMRKYRKKKSTETIRLLLIYYNGKKKLNDFIALKKHFSFCR